MVTTKPSTQKCNFMDDYSNGAHPKLLEALIHGNNFQQPAYGEDEFSRNARRSIRRRLQCGEEVGVWFVPSGTSANSISIASCLRPHEAVIAASSGHIVVRETGAIEATGHKIINVTPMAGKLTPAAITRALEDNWHFPHMAKPRLVYISNATELGTVYTREELTALKGLCRRNSLLLFMDGARLGAALASEQCNLDWQDVFELTDMFWIGGTKNGALLGEAIIIKDPQLAVDFGFYVKQHGCLLAKSWIVGAQFAELFGGGDDPDSDLLIELALHANEMAAGLSRAIVRTGYTLLATTETNQVFAILPNSLVKRLQHDFTFYIWEKRADQDMAVVRLVTCWATEWKQIQKFSHILDEWVLKGEILTHTI